MTKKIKLSVDQKSKVKATPKGGNRFSGGGETTDWEGGQSDASASQFFAVTFSDELHPADPGSDWPFTDIRLDKTLMVPANGTITTAPLKSGAHDWKYVVKYSGATSLDPRIIVRDDIVDYTDVDVGAVSSRNAYLTLGLGFLAGLAVGLFL